MLRRRPVVVRRGPGLLGAAAVGGVAYAAGRSGALESVPHNVIHGDVGGQQGLMSAFDTAALDPIFWLHHANIDRLWSVWLKRSATNSNPTDGAWLKQSFQLHDANGAVG